MLIVSDRDPKYKGLETEDHQTCEQCYKFVELVRYDGVIVCSVCGSEEW